MPHLQVRLRARDASQIIRRDIRIIIIRPSAGDMKIPAIRVTARTITAPETGIITISEVTSRITARITITPTTPIIITIEGVTSRITIAHVAVATSADTTTPIMRITEKITSARATSRTEAMLATTPVIITAGRQRPMGARDTRRTSPEILIIIAIMANLAIRSVMGATRSICRIIIARGGSVIERTTGMRIGSIAVVKIWRRMARRRGSERSGSSANRRKVGRMRGKGGKGGIRVRRWR